LTDTETGAAPSTRPGRAKRGEGELLREEIVEAAIDLLASTGTAERITIRNIAEQVGVTSPSIYLHFASKNDVIFAACERLWQDFGQVLVEARAGLNDPVERMRACGTAYLHFALDRPALYRVLFMSEPVDQPEDFDVQALLDNVGFLQLFDDVRELHDAGRLRVGDPLDVSLLLWSSVHGVASLILDHPKIPWPEPVRSLDLLFEALAGGLVTHSVPTGGGRAPLRSSG
jgi:AcrR family transcriptional regulator